MVGSLDGSAVKKNKSTACGCQRSARGCLIEDKMAPAAVGCFIEDKKSKSKRGNNSEKKMEFELSPFIVWIALWTVNTYSKFQVNIFSNNERYYKMSQFLHHHDDNAKAIANSIPRVFSKNSQAKNLVYIMLLEVCTDFSFNSRKLWGKIIKP